MFLFSLDYVEKLKAENELQHDYIKNVQKADKEVLTNLSEEIHKIHEHEDKFIWFSIIVLLAVLMLILFIVYKKRVNKSKDKTAEFDNFLYEKDSTTYSPNDDNIHFDN